MYLLHAEVDAPDGKVVCKMIVDEVWVLNKELLAVLVLVQHPKGLHLLLVLLPKPSEVVLGHLQRVRTTILLPRAITYDWRLVGGIGFVDKRAFELGLADVVDIPVRVLLHVACYYDASK